MMVLPLNFDSKTDSRADPFLSLGDDVSLTVTTRREDELPELAPFFTTLLIVMFILTLYRV